MAVIDASVLVAALVPADEHHELAVGWLGGAIETGETMHVPILGLAEVGGAIARQTGDGAIANKALAALRTLDLEVHEIDQALGEKAAELATTLRLRGADATYVALAHTLADSLVTLDGEHVERARAVIEVKRPPVLTALTEPEPCREAAPPRSQPMLARAFM